MNKKIWKKFIEYGSGFTIEAERDFETKGKPLYFHLFMYGFHYEDNYELTGFNLEELLKQAIKSGEKSFKQLNNLLRKYKRKKIMQNYIITKRENGEIVGKEVSRQRRWQIRNPEKRKNMQKKYKRKIKLLK